MTALFGGALRFQKLPYGLLRHVHFLPEVFGADAFGSMAQNNDLLQSVGGGHPDPMLFLQTVAGLLDVHIRRLREKLENNPADPQYIMTKWGVGYYFRK